MARTVGLVIAGLFVGGWIGVGWWSVQGGDLLVNVLGAALLGAVAVPWVSRAAKP